MSVLYKLSKQLIQHRQLNLHLIRTYVIPCQQSVNRFESEIHYIQFLKNLKRRRQRHQWVYTPFFIRNVQFLITTTNKDYINSNLTELQDLKNIAVSSANDLTSVYYSKKTSDYSSDLKSIIIEDRAHSSEEWSKLLSQIDENVYSLSIQLQGVMEFLMGRKVFYRNDDDPDIRTQPDWLNSSLFKSFLDFIFNTEKVLSVSQPALTILMADHQFCSDKKTVEYIIRKCDENITVMGIDLLWSCLSNPQTSYPACLNLIAQYETATTVLQEPYKFTYLQFVAETSLRNGDLEMGIKYLKHWFDKIGSCFNVKPILPLTVFAHLFHLCRYTDNATKWIENKSIISTFLGQYKLHGQTLTKQHAKILLKWFKSDPNISWKAKLFNNKHINSKTLECPITNVKMDKNELTLQEYEILKEELTSIMLERVLMKLDQQSFQKHVLDDSMSKLRKKPIQSTQNFLEFFSNHGPFDLVVDGMNALLNSAHKATKFDYIQHNILTVYRTCKQLKKNNPNCNIAIPIRLHIKKAVDESSVKLTDVAHVFVTSNDTYDDSLILYAALCSGPNCRLYSTDLYRDYAAIIHQKCGPATSELFLRYQKSRQIWRAMDKKKIFEHSLKFTINIQHNNEKNVWHFPFLKTTENQEQNAPVDWLCVYENH